MLHIGPYASEAGSFARIAETVEGADANSFSKLSESAVPIYFTVNVTVSPTSGFKGMCGFRQRDDGTRDYGALARHDPAGLGRAGRHA